MVTAIRKKQLTVDTSEVGSGHLRGQLATALSDRGCRFHSYDQFWRHFPEDSHHLPKQLVVAANLARIAQHYRKVNRHVWVASVRKVHVFFLAMVSTKEDERYVDLVDDLVRNSDLRLSVCRSMRETEFRSCIDLAVAAFDPSAVLSVKYSAAREGMGIEFSDGLLGFVRWADLGIGDQSNALILESATVGSRGRTVELLQKDGGLFEIDSASLRALLDSRVREQLEQSAEKTAVTVGLRVRAARQRAGLTQEALGGMSGIDQALISKLERGQHQPRYDTLERIAECFGVSVAALLAESPTDESGA